MSLKEILKNKNNLMNLSSKQLVIIILYLLKLVFALKKQLGDNDPSPTTPSSQIPPYKKGNRGKGKGKKKNGQKNGHEGSARKQNENITDKEDALPANGCSCGGTLGAPYPIRTRTYEDFGEVELKVVEVTIYGCRCNDCGKTHEGTPPGVLKGNMVGNKILIWSIYLHFFVGISFRNVANIFSRMLGITLTPGCLNHNWNKIADILEPAYKKLFPYLEKGGYSHTDESGWRVFGRTCWAWVFTNCQCCIYVITQGRGHEVAKEILGEFFSGVLISDFFSAYGLVDAIAKQKCYSHVFTEMKKCLKIDSSVNLKDFCKKLKRLLKDAMRLKLAFLQGQIGAIEYISSCQNLEKRLDELLRLSPGRVNKHTKRLIKRLRKYRGEIFTFLYHEHVEATNNTAERRIRLIALMRKISFGSYSQRGVKTRYILMSLLQTCKILNVDFIKYASYAVSEHTCGRDVPGVHEYIELKECMNNKMAA